MAGFFKVTPRTDKELEEERERKVQNTEPYAIYPAKSDSSETSALQEQPVLPESGSVGPFGAFFLFIAGACLVFTLLYYVCHPDELKNGTGKWITVVRFLLLLFLFSAVFFAGIFVIALFTAMVESVPAGWAAVLFYAAVNILPLLFSLLVVFSLADGINAWKQALALGCAVAVFSLLFAISNICLDSNPLFNIIRALMCLGVMFAAHIRHKRINQRRLAEQRELAKRREEAELLRQAEQRRQMKKRVRVTCRPKSRP